ncbi:hypothetical protein FACS1894187_19920 [Synergistales bacterium]|nr:hypothetical protein FACS1894187_19920 [Synergistales bacterium]
MRKAAEIKRMEKIRKLRVLGQMKERKKLREAKRREEVKIERGMKERKGFTLIELVCAVMIIGIIFGGVAGIHLARFDHVRKMQFQQDELNIQEAISCYLFFHGDEIENLRELTMSELFKKGFLIGENKSPQGEPYELILGESAIVVGVENLSARKYGQ